MYGQIVITALTLAFGIAGWFIFRQTERIKILENKLYENKYKVYSGIVDLIFSILDDYFNGKSISVNNLNKYKRDLLLYGTDDIYKSFNKWLLSCNDIESFNSSQENNLYFMKCLIEFVLEIRKDMQSKKTELSIKDVLINLSQSEQKIDEIISKMNNLSLK